eukprot:scaffold5048_cov83-Skeletonema_marinoi.AAC.7
MPSRRTASIAANTPLASVITVRHRFELPRALTLYPNVERSRCSSQTSASCMKSKQCQLP